MTHSLAAAEAIFLSAQNEWISIEYGLESAIDTTWVLIAAFLVFFMNLGSAMIESGMQRSKNSTNICTKNLLNPAIGGLVFFIIGFGLEYGTDIGGVIGDFREYFMLTNTAFYDVWQKTNVNTYAYFLFATMFATTACGIVSGAVGERIKFSAYIIFTTINFAIIYPIEAHWVWGGGWLSELGMIDFAGSAVVEMTGGVAALAGAIAVGPRLGKYVDGKVNMIRGHNISLSTIGAFVLWFGWFGFNPGSTAAATVPNIAEIAVNTNLAAAGGAVSAMLTAWLSLGKPDVGMIINGLIAGLVSITGGCASFSPTGSLIVGILSGVIVVFSVQFIDRILKIDDPVGAVSSYGVCGAFGALAIGLFADGSYSGGVNGVLFGGGLTQLVVQSIGVVSIAGFVFVASLITFKILDLVIGIRISEEEEILGLDITQHGMSAYPDFEIPS